MEMFFRDADHDDLIVDEVVCSNLKSDKVFFNGRFYQMLN